MEHLFSVEILEEYEMQQLESNMNSHAFVVVQGGLGNQMFQAAYGIALASEFELESRLIDVATFSRVSRTWGLGCFNIHPYPAKTFLRVALGSGARLVKKFPRLGSLYPGVVIDQDDFHKALRHKEVPRLVIGYWQNPGYFSKVDSQVRKMFAFPSIPTANALNSDASLPVVAIHVRRGDYVSDPIANKVHLVCDADWYKNAWRTLRADIGECQALIFSDDPNWVAENVRLDGVVQYVDSDSHQPAWIDMARMSHCNHFIISNSSYSWWAAYLATSPSKRVYAPKFWFKDRETASLGICPDNWTLL